MNDDAETFEIRIPMSAINNPNDRVATISEEDGVCVITVPDDQHIEGGNTIECVPDRIEVEPEACEAFFGGHRWNRSDGHSIGFTTFTTRTCRLCGLRQQQSTEWEDL